MQHLDPLAAHEEFPPAAGAVAGLMSGDAEFPESKPTSTANKSSSDRSA